jgi:hypothetical protein
MRWFVKRYFTLLCKTCCRRDDRWYEKGGSAVAGPPFFSVLWRFFSGVVEWRFCWGFCRKPVFLCGVLVVKTW